MGLAQWQLDEPAIEVGIILKFNQEVALGQPPNRSKSRACDLNAKKEATPRPLPFLIKRGYWPSEMTTFRMWATSRCG